MKTQLFIDKTEILLDACDILYLLNGGIIVDNTGKIDARIAGSQELLKARKLFLDKKE